ncbi:MAG: phasin, partial [Caulobacteraceae bacterium]
MIAARTGLMAQGLTSAKGQDLKELSLMSSEKAEALSASAGAVSASAGAIGQR